MTVRESLFFLFCLSLVSGEFIYHSREQKEFYKDNSPYGYQGIFINKLGGKAI